MKPRLVTALFVLVLVPLGLVSWLGVRTANQEYYKVQETFHSLLKSKFSELDSQIANVLQERRLALEKLTDREYWTIEEYHQIQNSNPFITQLFAQASDGRLVFPAPGKLLPRERDFLIRTQAIFDQKILLSSKTEVNNERTRMRTNEDYRNVGPDEGWETWFWDSDIKLLFWRRTSGNGVIGAELSRVRLIADIIGVLPDTARNDPLLASGEIMLADSQNKPLYKWGTSGENYRVLFTMPLSSPLLNWSLQFDSKPDALSREFSTGIYIQVLSALFALGLTLSGLAFYLYREYNKSLVEAEQRVSFVNHVSHELKTPLTNIRMYAELLENNLPEDDPESRQKLEVILSESRRLSRMIGNVLTFSRHQKGKLQLKPCLSVPDRKIASVLESFQPALLSRGISLETDLNASSEISHDSDILEQILGNLISNVEKYAWKGKKLIVKSSVESDVLSLWVRDYGPGIPEEKRFLIFQPFVRLSDRTDEGASGTGIGLSIIRDLARLHGGDVMLVFNNGICADPDNIPDPKTPLGTCFLAQIPKKEN
ncbi:MAG: HAMP domain-containing histidine kinase [Candidatus Riflebacteria bacterium]|nr:HAMP domain-containing histidine kinase [Candidatus Riflebacteria bacterium]